MKKVVKNLIIWVVLSSAIVIGGIYAQDIVRQRFFPATRMVEDELQERLNPRTREEKKILEDALDKDPIGAYVSVLRSEQAWDDIKNFIEKGLPAEREIIRDILLEAQKRQGVLRDDKTAKAEFEDTMARFAENAFGRFVFLKEIGEENYAREYIQSLRDIEPEEYLNVAYDASYPYFKQGISTENLNTFRNHQSHLTPVLLAAHEDEWDRIISAYERALPKVADIFDEKYEHKEVSDIANWGEFYGMTYMLHHENISRLQERNISLWDAIEFVAANDWVITTDHAQERGWLVLAEELTNISGPSLVEDGETLQEEMTLFDWCKIDPSYFWLVTHDGSPGAEYAKKTLEKYADTDITAVLMLSYADPDMHIDPALKDPIWFEDDQEKRPEGLLDVALEALVRFDQEIEVLDSDGESYDAARGILWSYRDDLVFKEKLVELGPILIPAITAEKRAWELIRDDSNFIGRYVDEDGNPRRIWWRWIPGGGIIWVIGEGIEGRFIWRDFVWVGKDVLIFTPIGVKAKSALAAKSAYAAGAAKTGTGAGIAAKGGLKTKMLASSGIKTNPKWATYLAKAGGGMLNHPITTAVGVGSAFYFLAPDSVVDVAIERVTDRTKNIVVSTAKMAGETAAKSVLAGLSVPKELAEGNPILLPAYWGIMILIMLLIITLPLILLKVYLSPVYWAFKSIIMPPVKAVHKTSKSIIEKRFKRRDGKHE